MTILNGDFPVRYVKNNKISSGNSWQGQYFTDDSFRKGTQSSKLLYSPI